MAETYYRLHGSDTPEFSAQNAWSALWGEQFSADGSRYKCRTCDGTGTAYGEPCDARCDDGWLYADPGYSCCETAADLLDYFDQHGIAADDDPVVVFEGERVGTGFDGEPLAVPTGDIRWTTIGALRAQATGGSH
jgi:hypothetical protein